MKVLFAPISPDNPYQSNLKKGLERFGVEVSFVHKNTLLYFFRVACGRHRYDLLHLHWSHNYILDNSLLISVLKTILFFCSIYFFRCRGTRIVWTVHNLEEHERRHPNWEKHVNKLLLMFYDRIIVHSEYCKLRAIDHWQDVDKSKYKVIPHGNYIENYPNDLSQEEARKFLDLSKDSKVFLFFGLIRGYKGVDSLIELFKSDDLKDALLLVAGMPKTDEIWQYLIGQTAIAPHDNIKLYLEYLPDENIQYLMNASDAVLFSFSDIFTSGSVILAMSFGKAIIAPDLPALETLKKSGGIKSYNQTNIDDLNKLLVTLSKEKAAVLGKRNYHAILSLGWYGVAKQTFRVYENALK